MMSLYNMVLLATVLAFALVIADLADAPLEALCRWGGQMLGGA